MRKSFLYITTLLTILALSYSQQTKDGQTIVNACTSALMQIIPPVWCKIKGDRSIDPTACPTGYRRHGSKCFVDCKSGYVAQEATCYQKCETGYTLKAGKCVSKNDSYKPLHYGPDSITNCNESVKCPTNTFKAGCKCEKDCSAIGLENCVLGSCAIDSDTCADTIINIIKDVVKGIVDFVSFCLTLGTSSGLTVAKNSVANGLEKAGKKGIEVYTKSLVKIFESKFKSTIKSNAKKAAKSLFKSFANGSIKNVDPEDVCDPVYQFIESKVKNKKASTVVNNIVSTLDVFDVSSIVNNCSQKKKVECVQSCLDTAKNFDPTGLLTIARAFVQPTCEIPVSLKASHNNIPVKDGCIQLFTEVNFQGDKIELCNGFEDLEGIIENVKSLKISSSSSFMFYKDETLDGEHRLLDLATNIRDLDSYFGEKDIRDKMKYALKLKDDCINIFLTDINGVNMRHEICENTVIDLDFDDIVDFSIETYRNGVSYELFENNDFSGVSAYLTNGISELPDMNRIGSIRLIVEYDDYGFLCGGEAGTNEIIRMGHYDVECFSFDGINCVNKEMSRKECLKFINDNIFSLQPVLCGNAYKSRHEINGYETKGHWCQKGIKYFKH